MLANIAKPIVAETLEPLPLKLYTGTEPLPNAPWCRARIGCELETAVHVLPALQPEAVNVNVPVSELIKIWVELVMNPPAPLPTWAPVALRLKEQVVLMGVVSLLLAIGVDPA